MEQTTANAPGANVIVYEAADTLNSTFDDMYEQTVTDSRVDVVTTSFGQCEAGADPHEIAADNDLFEEAAAQGQTRFAASGDNGAQDCGLNSSAPSVCSGFPSPTTVDFPAKFALRRSRRRNDAHLEFRWHDPLRNRLAGERRGRVAVFRATGVSSEHRGDVREPPHNVPDAWRSTRIRNTPYAPSTTTVRSR